MEHLQNIFKNPYAGKTVWDRKIIQHKPEQKHISNISKVQLQHIKMDIQHSDFEKYMDKHHTKYNIDGNSFGANVYSSAENIAVGDMFYSIAKDAKVLAGMAQNKDTCSSAKNQSV